jgi:Xaa-Pro aminopeptidase
LSARLDRLRDQLPAELACVLVTNGTNVRYLTGFASSNAALLVDRERVRLLTDGRYVDAARSVPGIDLVESARDIAKHLGQHLTDLTGGPVGFEAASLSYARYQHVAASGVELVPTEGMVERLRAVKEPEELAAIRQSAALLSEAFERLSRERLTGRTEADIAWWMERTIRELGAEGVAFAPIVGSGPNAARPHHHPGDRVIGEGETVVVDAGALLDGYCSDCTRTFATGALPPALQRAYDVCLDVQRRSLEAVAVGASGKELDGRARSMLLEHGYEVMHGLGHALGLEIHEDPRLSETSTDTLEAGNVVTVEPGVYLSGLGGVRIEDLVIVTGDAPEVLTSFTKELVETG